MEVGMTPEKKEKLQGLRHRLANLTPEERQAFSDCGLVATVEGRTLSLRNTWMVYIQSNGQTPTVVGGFHQWRKAGRQVQKGQHGYTILFPVGNKTEDGEITEASRFYTGTVFDVSQTAPIGASEPAPVSPPAPQAQAPSDPIMAGWARV